MLKSAGCRNLLGLLNRLPHIHQHQIGIIWLGAGRRQHGVDLAAMMGLMIEEVSQEDPFCLAHIFLEQA